MATTVDQRVVQMQFDNKQFEAGIQETLNSLNKLNDTIEKNTANSGKEMFKGMENRMSLANGQIEKINYSLDTVRDKMSAIGTIGDQILRNIGNGLTSLMRKGANFVLQGPKGGFSEYEDMMGSVQTIMAGTGESVKKVNAALDDLNEYADKTIYSFKDMTSNIGKFTNQGLSLDTSVAAIKGIANEAAISGANAQQASHAMYNFAQALSSGYTKLIDWKSIENSMMATVEFKDTLLQTAEALHTVQKEGNLYTTLTTNMKGKTSSAFNAQRGFNDSLSYQWLTNDVLTQALKVYATDVRDLTDAERQAYEAQLKQIGLSNKQIYSFEQLGIKAADAAKDVKTFSMLVDTLTEAIGSGWTQTWRTVIGDFDEAKGLWTGLSNILGDVISKISDTRNSMLAAWKDMGGRTVLLQSIVNVLNAIWTVIEPIKKAIADVLGFNIDDGGKALLGATSSLETFTRNMILTRQEMENVYTVAKTVFGTIKSFFDTILTYRKPILDFLLIVTMLKAIRSLFMGGLGLNTIASLFKIIVAFNLIKVISGIHSESKGLAGVLETVSAALKKIWDRISNSNVLRTLGTIIAYIIAGLIDGITKIVNKLRSLDWDKIKDNAKTVGNVILTVLQAIGFALASVIGLAIAGISKVASFFSSIDWSGVGDNFKAVGTVFSAAFQNIGAIISTGIDGIKGKLSGNHSGKSFTLLSLFTGKKEDNVKVASGVTTSLKGVNESLTTSGKIVEDTTEKTTALQAGAEALHPVIIYGKNIFETIGLTLKNVANNIYDVLVASGLAKTVLGNALEDLKNADWQKILAFGFLVLYLRYIKKLSNAVSGFSKKFVDVGSTVKNTLNAITSYLSGITTNNQKKFRDIAIGIGILTASFIALATVPLDPDKIQRAGIAIASLAAVVVASTIAMSGAMAKFSKSVNVAGLTALAATISVITINLLALGAEFVVLAGIIAIILKATDDVKTRIEIIGIPLATIAVGLIALTAIIKKLSSVSSAFKADLVAGTMIKLAIGIASLSAAVIFANLAIGVLLVQFSALAAEVVAVVAAFYGIFKAIEAAVNKWTNLDGTMVAAGVLIGGIGGAIVAIVAVLKILGSVIKKLNTLTRESAVSIALFAVALAALSISINMVMITVQGFVAKLATMAGTIAAYVRSLYQSISSLTTGIQNLISLFGKAFGITVEIPQMLHGIITAIAGVIAIGAPILISVKAIKLLMNSAIVTASKITGSITKVAASLALLSAALIGFSIAAKIIAKLKPEEAFTGVLGIIGMIAMLAMAVKLLDEAKVTKVAGGILALVAAIYLLLPAAAIIGLLAQPMSIGIGIMCLAFLALGKAIQMMSDAKPSKILPTIAALVLAVAALGQLAIKFSETEGMDKGVTGVSVLIAGVSFVVYKLTEMAKGMTQLQSLGLAAIIASFGGIVIALSYIVYQLSQLKDPSSLAGPVIAISVLMAVFAGSIKLMGSVIASFTSLNIAGFAVIIGAFAGAVALLSFVIYQLASLDPNKTNLAPAVLSLLATMVVFSACIAVIANVVSDMMTLDVRSFLATIISFAAAITVLGLTITLMATLPIEKLQASAIALNATMIIFTLCIVALAEFSDQIGRMGAVGMSALIISLAASIAILSASMLLLSQVDSSKLGVIAVTLGIFAGIIIGLNVVFGIFGANIALVIGALTAFNASVIGVLAAAVPVLLSVAAVIATISLAFISFGAAAVMVGVGANLIATAFNAVSGALQGFINYLIGISAYEDTIKEMVIVVGSMMGMFLKVAVGALALGGALLVVGAGATVAGLGLNAFAMGILAVVGALQVAVLSVSGFMALFDAIGGEVGTWGTHMMQNLGGGIEAGISFVTNAVNAVTEAIASFLHFSDGPEEGAIQGDNMLTWGLHAIQKWISGLGEGGEGLSGVLDGITQKIADFFTNTEIAGTNGDVTGAIIDKTKNAASEVSSTVTSAGSDVTGAVKDTVNTVVGDVQEGTDQITEDTSDAGTDSIESLLKGVASGEISIKDAMSKFGAMMKDKLTEMFDGDGTGNSMISQLGTALANGESPLNAICSALGFNAGSSFGFQLITAATPYIEQLERLATQAEQRLINAKDAATNINSVQAEKMVTKRANQKDLTRKNNSARNVKNAGSNRVFLPFDITDLTGDPTNYPTTPTTPTGGGGGAADSDKSGKGGSGSKSTKDATEALKEYTKVIDKFDKRATPVLTKFAKTFGTIMSSLNKQTPYQHATKGFQKLLKEIYKTSDKADTVYEDSETKGSALEQRANDIREAYVKAFDDITESVKGTIDFFEKFDKKSRSLTKSSQLLRNARSQVSALKEAEEGLMRLSFSGVSDTLISELGKDPLANYDKIKELNRMTRDQRKEFDKLNQEQKELSQNAAVVTMFARSVALSYDDLRKSGVKAYNELDESTKTYVDYVRAVNEHSPLDEATEKLQKIADKTGVSLDTLMKQFQSTTDISGITAATILENIDLLNDKFEESKNILDDFEEEAESFASSFADTMSSFGGAFSDFSITDDTTPDKLFNNLTKRITGAQSMMYNILALQERGLNGKAVMELMNEGAGALSAAMQFTSKQIADINRKYDIYDNLLEVTDKEQDFLKKFYLYTSASSNTKLQTAIKDSTEARTGIQTLVNTYQASFGDMTSDQMTKEAKNGASSAVKAVAEEFEGKSGKLKATASKEAKDIADAAADSIDISKIGDSMGLGIYDALGLTAAESGLNKFSAEFLTACINYQNAISKTGATTESVQKEFDALADAAVKVGATEEEVHYVLDHTSDAQKALGQVAVESFKSIVNSVIEAKNTMLEFERTSVQVGQAIGDALSGVDIYQEISTSTDKIKPSEIISRMIGNTRAMEREYANYAKLITKGVSKEVLADLVDQGADYVEAATKWSDEEVKVANSTKQRALSIPTEAETAARAQWLRTGKINGKTYLDSITEYSTDVTKLQAFANDFVTNFQGILDPELIELAQESAELFSQNTAETTSEGLNVLSSTVGTALDQFDKLYQKTMDSGTALSKWNESLISFGDSVKSSLTSTIDIFDKVNKSHTMTTKDLMDNMQAQIEYAKQMAANMQTLLEKGADPKMIEALASKGADYVAAAAAATQDELKQMNGWYAESLKLPDTAKTQLEDTMKQFATIGGKKYNEVLAETLQNTEELNQAGQTLSAALAGVVDTSLVQSAVTSANQYIAGVAGVMTSDETTAQLTAAGQSGSTAVTQGMVQGTQSATANVTGTAENLATNTKNAVSNVLNESAGNQIGANFAQGLVNGLESKRADLQQKASEIAQIVANAASQTLQIHSPSKVAERIGSFFDQGLVNGLEAEQTSVEAASRNIAGSLVDVMNTPAMDGFDTDIQPVITPVMDMSNVDAGLNSMNSMLAQNRAINLDPNIGQITTPNSAMWQAMQSRGTTTNNDYSMGGIAINVYGAQGQDPNDLANLVMDKFTKIYNRRKAVFS